MMIERRIKLNYASKGERGCLAGGQFILTVTILALNILPTMTSGLYEDSATAVVDLHPANFRRVVDSEDVWLVEFYAPWCGHCKALVPEYLKVAEALKGIAKVGAVDVDQHGSLGSDYGVQGFPTIKIFGADKKKPDDYKGARKAKEIVNAVLETLRVVAHGRLGTGGKTTGDSGYKSRSSDGIDVVELTDANFEETVLKSDDMWLVEFYAPWCGHCKNLEPHWASAASELRGKVKLGALDSTVHTVTASRYGVRGYPTIKYFSPGKKDKNADEYDGGRTSSDIVQWAIEKLAANIPPPDIRQVTSDVVLKSACEDHQLCIVSVLPHILDCQSECRNDYLNVLKKLGDKYKKHMWGWVWTEGGSQSELEDSLGIGGFGYPAMAAMNSRKMKYTLLRGSFSYDGINEFLKELAFGRASTLPVKGAKLPSITPIEPWDGKDGKLDIMEDVDDIDLDMGEELLDKDEL